MPSQQTKKRRLWLGDGSCIRLRPERQNHDEYTHECLASVPRRSWKNTDVIETLADLMLMHGCPAYLRSDNGSEFTAKKVRARLSNAGVITAYIEPGSPWKKGYIENFNGRMRDEFLNGGVVRESV